MLESRLQPGRLQTQAAAQRASRYAERGLLSPRGPDAAWTGLDTFGGEQLVDLPQLLNTLNSFFFFTVCSEEEKAEFSALEYPASWSGQKRLWVK